MLDTDLVRLNLWEGDWQLIVRDGNGLVIAAKDNGEGFAPVALAAEEPVTKLVVDLDLVGEKWG